MSEPLIDVRGLCVRVRRHDILQSVDLSVGPGEIVTLIGPNGSGKTTLVRAVLGLLPPSAGQVLHKPGIRFGYVPQSVVVDHTLPLTVRRFLRLGTPGAPEEQLARVLDEVGAPGLLDRAVQETSGGQFKRILLARALLRAPDVLVLDEPGAGVDVTGQSAFYRLIRDIRDRHHCGILLVSHDLHLVMAATDRVVCLNRHVCCHGVPESVTRHPEYLALFGDSAMEGLAVYTHHHDHTHDLAGRPRPSDGAHASDRHRTEGGGHG